MKGNHSHHHGPGFGPGFGPRGDSGEGSDGARRGGPRRGPGGFGFGPGFGLTFGPQAAGGEGQEGPKHGGPRRGAGGPGGGFGPGFGFGPGGPGGPGGRGPGGRGGFGPRGRGRGGAPEAPDASDAAGWFAGRLPGGWFTGAPTVTVDRDEILVVGQLPPVEHQDGADEATIAAAEAGRIARFREETREQRIEIARQAEHQYGRAVSWGASVGSTTEMFTTASVPVMTRLRQAERQILDTLIDSGVARSRSDAVVWAIRLVGEHTQDWLGELREAMEAVNRVRDKGPTVS